MVESLGCTACIYKTCAIAGEVSVELRCDLYGGRVADGPEGGDDLRESGDLKRCGDVGWLVGYRGCWGGGGAGGQVGQFRVRKPLPGDHCRGQRLAASS